MVWGTYYPPASQVAQWVKNPPAMQETWFSIPGLGRSLGGGHGNPLQYSCLESPMDRGAWQATQPMGLQRIGHNWATNTWLDLRSSSAPGFEEIKINRRYGFCPQRNQSSKHIITIKQDKCPGVFKNNALCYLEWKQLSDKTKGRKRSGGPFPSLL